MNEALCMMGVGEVMTPGGAARALTSLMSPLNTTSSAFSLSMVSFISSWMASASCAAYGDRDGEGLGGLGTLRAGGTGHLGPARPGT